MKPSKLLVSFLLAAGSSLLAVSSASAQTTYTWDVSGAGVVTGGTGAWNTSNSLWTTDAGATNTSWINASPAPFNNATFGGTAGTVTLGEAISIRNLNFTNTAGAYTITGSTLNFTGGTITGPISSAIESAIIQSNITGAPAINLQPMAGDRQFTLRPAASGSMSIGAVTGDGGNGSEKLNLQGGAGSTGTVASVTGPKVVVSGGSWTLSGTSTGRDHSISAGTLTLNAGLTATHRAVILSGGTLNYNVASAVSATVATTISTDNGFRITGGTLDNTSGAAINTNASTTHIDLAGTLTFAGTNGANSNLHLGSGVVWLKDGNRQITVTNSLTTLTIGGVIQNDDTTGRALTKAGAGTLSLSGSSANTYNGTTTVNGGVLALNKTAGVNAIAGAITLGDGATTAGNDILRLDANNQIVDTAVITFNAATGANAGIFRLNNRSETVAGIASTGGGGIIENESGSAATSTLTVNNAATQSFSGILRDGDGSGTDGTLALTKNGNGTLTLSGSSTYSGGTTVSAGTLTVGHVNALGTAGVSVTGGTLNLSNFAVANSITASGGAIIGANTSTNVTFSNAGAINGNFGSINTGTDPSRAIDTTSGLTVNVLSGQGTFSGGLVTVTQAHNPGNSPGSQTFNDGLSYADNTTATFEIAANGSAWDSIAVNNGLTIGNSVTLALSLFGAADYGTIFWDSAQTFQLITANTTTGSFNSITYTGLGDYAAEGTWNYNQASGALTWTAIPEPGAALLGSLGLLALLRRRRG